MFSLFSLTEKQEDNIDKSILPGKIKSIKKSSNVKKKANATEVSKISRSAYRMKLYENLKTSQISHFVCNASLHNIWDLKISDTSYCLYISVHVTAVL